MMDIKNILKKNEKLYYIIYCLYKVNSKKFRKKVLDISTNPYGLEFKHFGKKNPENIYYLIEVGDETKGFCSAIRDTLYYLMYAEALHFVPHIKYTDNMPYYENEGIDGKKNIFEYYFVQPSELSYEELCHCSKVAIAESVHLKGIFNLNDLNTPDSYYSDDEAIIDKCSKLFRKYFVLNEKTSNMLEKDMSIISPSELIGVHYRGTDFKVGYNGHPTAVAYEKHILETEKLLKTGMYKGVFLATEDGDIIDTFKEKFGKKLFLYEDVVRGTGMTNAYNMHNERKNHKYLLGYEVLRDVYTLAHCKAFVSSMSGVGITSQILKKALYEEFSEIHVLSAGINVSKKILQKNKY